MKKLTALLVILCLCLASCSAPEGDAAVWALPRKAKKLNLTGPIKTSLVAPITGENSANKTESRFEVWGTDLGSMAEMNGKVYMFTGDTYDSALRDNWRSNVLFIIEDDKPADGLTITDAITDGKGRALELITSSKVDNVQLSTIPTNIFAVNDTLYCIYMSIKQWTQPSGSWICGFSSLAKSTDEGKTWKKLNNVKWPGDSNFIQTANCQVGDTMYFWGIPAGRYGGVALMKVNIGEIEDYEAYEYFTGTDEKGNPLWIKGSEGVSQAKIIIEGNVGEISVIYNEYLGNFIMTYLKEPNVGIVLREGVTPWGEWSQEHMMVPYGSTHIPYGAFMLPRYVEQKGKTFYFAMSQYLPVYNIMWMKAELP